MVYVLWLVFMGLIVGFVAMPLAQRFGFAYGRFGRLGDMIAVLVLTILGGVVFAALLGAVANEFLRESGWVVGALVGAVVGVLLLALFATKAAADEPNTAGDIN